MGDGTEGNPLTRKDVLKAIEKNGGTATGLDLSEQTFIDAIDLSDLDLHGIIFRDARFPTHFESGQLVGAKFNGSDLRGADPRSINFQYAQFKKLNKQPTCLAIADLRGSLFLNANFQGADLVGAKFGAMIEKEAFQVTTPAAAYPAAMLDDTDFRGANLFRTNFKGCYFYGTKLEGAFIRGADILDAHLEEVDWGNYIIGEEKEGEKKGQGHFLKWAEEIYRRLKMWYPDAGMYGTAAKFYYREKEASRKALKWRSKHRLALEASHIFFGYGEKWWNILLWMIAVIFGFAAAYYFRGSFGSSSFLDTLYYSAASFTALGYGNWAPEPTGWAKYVGAIEAFMGVSMMALLLVTFVRKWAR